MNVWLTDCFPLPIMVEKWARHWMVAHYADSDGYWMIMYAHMPGAGGIVG